MKKKAIKINTPTIMTPNWIGEIIGETPKTITIKISKGIFTPKTSGTGLKHSFNTEKKEWFNQSIGREIKFWKKDGKEIGGDRMIAPESLIDIK
jgi:hypothetical protein